jgi:branched-chain amino acid aminotransferase
VATEDARVPIADRGFLYGDGCFETIRIHRGAPFRLDAHLARLRQGLEILRFDTPWSDADLRGGARKVVEENEVVDGLLRITVTAPEDTEVPGRAIITSRSLPEVPARPALHVASTVRRIAGPLGQCKTISRAVESVAHREAQAEGAFDAILLNERQRVVETTSRNVFLVSEGELRTPRTSDGALAGVTRMAVLEIARGLGLRAREASLTILDVRRAEEVFLTGSGVGVLGIASVDEHRYQVPGSVTTRLRDVYASLVDGETKW